MVKLLSFKVLGLIFAFGLVGGGIFKWLAPHIPFVVCIILGLLIFFWIFVIIAVLIRIYSPKKKGGLLYGMFKMREGKEKSLFWCCAIN